MRSLSPNEKKVLSEIEDVLVRAVPKYAAIAHRELVHLAVAELLVCNIMAINGIPYDERLIAECADQCIYTLRTNIIPNELARIDKRKPAVPTILKDG